MIRSLVLTVALTAGGLVSLPGTAGAVDEFPQDCAQSGATITCTAFDHIAMVRIPANATAAHVVVTGGAGGAAGANTPGGAGGVTATNLDLTLTRDWAVLVGENGHPGGISGPGGCPTTGGAGGITAGGSTYGARGGNGMGTGCGGGGGGGLTYVESLSEGNPFIVLAGGGGGAASGNAGGKGGGTPDAAGNSGSQDGQGVVGNVGLGGDRRPGSLDPTGTAGTCSGNPCSGGGGGGGGYLRGGTGGNNAGGGGGCGFIGFLGTPNVCPPVAASSSTPRVRKGKVSMFPPPLHRRAARAHTADSVGGGSVVFTLSFPSAGHPGRGPAPVENGGTHNNNDPGLDASNDPSNHRCHPGQSHCRRH